jgi:hypothetical protein
MASKAFPRTATLLLLLLACALPALAGSPSAADKWRTGLKEIDQKLRAQQWQAAEEQSRKVARLIVQDAGIGQGAAYSLAVVSAFQAIAEKSLGRVDEANWHWDVALNLFPDIAKTDVSPYGPAAAELSKRMLRSVDPNRTDPTNPRVADNSGEPVTQEDVERPRIVKQVAPEFPKNLAEMSVAGVLVVEAVIGFDGVPRLPLVLQMTGGGPAMEYVALEALRQWRFEPAKVDGKPVGVYYSLTVNFAARR